METFTQLRAAAFASRCRIEAEAEAVAACKRLNDKQREVLILRSKGVRWKALPEAMQTGETSIQWHTKQMLKNLGVDTMVEAAVIATKAGLV